MTARITSSPTPFERTKAQALGSGHVNLTPVPRSGCLCGCLAIAVAESGNGPGSSREELNSGHWFRKYDGRSVFNSVLSDGLMSQLEQSPILQLISEQRLRQDAGYLGRPIPDHLSDADVRDLSIREGIKASISGSIRRLGKAYVVTVTARNIATGDLLVTEEAEAASKEHVMNALSKVATGVRRKLGESIDSIQKLDTPLGQATTPSLDAFEAYALGDAEHEKAHDVPEAEGYYRQAVAIDPNFAMAWARLGAIHQGADGKKYLTKAFDLSKNISEREQLYIQGLYYSLALGDIPKTISTLEACNPCLSKRVRELH